MVNGWDMLKIIVECVQLLVRATNHQHVTYALNAGNKRVLQTPILRFWFRLIHISLVVIKLSLIIKTKASKTTNATAGSKSGNDVIHDVWRNVENYAKISFNADISPLYLTQINFKLTFVFYI